MRRALRTTTVLAGIIFVTLVSTASASYTTQLTFNSYKDIDGQTNNTGQTVWQGCSPKVNCEGNFANNTEIFLYSNGVNRQLTTTDNDGDRHPQINNAGQVTWESRTGIFLSSNGIITKIANGTGYSYPKINDAGQIVWHGSDASDNEIFIYSHGVVTQITNNDIPDSNPNINSSGDVVWAGGGWPGNKREIFLYRSGTITKLTDNSYTDEAPVINDSGQVAWQAWDSTSIPYQNIFFYSNGITTRIATPGSGGDTNPDINNQGEVVWEAAMQDGAKEIFLYSASQVIRLTNTIYNEVNPQISDQGQVVWSGIDDDSGVNGEEIFLHDTRGTIKVTENSSSDVFPMISDTGYIAWQTFAGNYEIFLRTPFECDAVRPALQISLDSVFWYSYLEYTNRKLSVNLAVQNMGVDKAYHVSLTGFSNSDNVSLSSQSLPIGIWDMDPGSTQLIMSAFRVPAGVNRFRTTITAKAESKCGVSYLYP